MSQLWTLALLCGLLTGTSASLLGTLGKGLNDAAHSVHDVLDGALQTVENILGSDQENLEPDLKASQDASILQKVKQRVLQIKNLENVDLHLLSPEVQALGLKLNDLQILDIKTEISPDSQGLNLMFPIRANVSMNLPVIGQLINLTSSLDLLSSVGIAKDDQTGLRTMVLEGCVVDPDSVQLKLQGR
ncbi:PREDICTED: BPI fold-containing family A member 2 [Condylura cristata]|uniref:BPI fold-containing family A member 2 n=1 Tax=Condylura cristata TaxID=143302 RepID=UPI000642EFA9|nr:PREDICTED: BPI fold-containing family A member 2 [Condylura cristata]